LHCSLIVLIGLQKFPSKATRASLARARVKSTYR
jgi:hypothetical protein